MAEGNESVRIDKWLWAVRVCKTRAQATDLCERGRVKIDDNPAKPSRKVRAQQIVKVRGDGIERQYQVLQCIEKRVGAPEAAACKLDLTPQEDLDRLSAIRKGGVPFREKGAGRPTKRDRRMIDKLRGGAA